MIIIFIIVKTDPYTVMVRRFGLAFDGLIVANRHFIQSFFRFNFRFIGIYVKQRSRHISAGMMVLLYLVITALPLAPLLVSSARFAHAVTGECSGDCDIDGCPLESRASHTCCCWQKKQRSLQYSEPQASGKICCATPPQPAVNTAAPCCAAPPGGADHGAADNGEGTGHHCSGATASPAQPTDEDSRLTVYTCGCPCGSGKVLALWNSLKHEAMPNIGPEILHLPSVATLFTDVPRTAESLPGDPPDPPPKVPTLS